MLISVQIALSLGADLSCQEYFVVDALFPSTSVVHVKFYVQENIDVVLHHLRLVYRVYSCETHHTLSIDKTRRKYYCRYITHSNIQYIIRKRTHTAPKTGY